MIKRMWDSCLVMWYTVVGCWLAYCWVFYDFGASASIGECVGITFLAIVAALVGTAIHRWGIWIVTGKKQIKFT